MLPGANQDIGRLILEPSSTGSEEWEFCSKRDVLDQRELLENSFDIIFHTFKSFSYIQKSVRVCTVRTV